MEIIVTYTLDHVTPRGTAAYSEVVPEGTKSQVVGSQYLRKDVYAAMGEPTEITVTIAAKAKVTAPRAAKVAAAKAPATTTRKATTEKLPVKAAPARARSKAAATK